jgi:hypothetical protein
MKKKKIFLELFNFLLKSWAFVAVYVKIITIPILFFIIISIVSFVLCMIPDVALGYKIVIFVFCFISSCFILEYYFPKWFLKNKL